MSEKLGKVIISPGVLTTIARLTALSIPGVARLGTGWTDSVGRWMRRKRGGDGVHIEVEDDTVTVDLYIIVEPDVNMLRLSQEIQTNVTRAIQDMVGLTVKEVNIHIQDVEIPQEQ